VCARGAHRALLGGPSTSPLGDGMDTPLHSDVAWLLTLSAAERARFLALVAHELTVWGRLSPFQKVPRLKCGCGLNGCAS
jgi:hypothetical protein